MLDLDCELALNQALLPIHRLALALQRVVLDLNIDLRDLLQLLPMPLLLHMPLVQDQPLDMPLRVVLLPG